MLLEWSILQDLLQANPEFWEDLEIVVELADKILAEYGFLNGLPAQVYWSEKHEKWRRVHPALDQAITNRAMQQLDQTPEGEKSREWINNPKKPWRKSMFFKRWVRRYVPQNSLLDLAIEMKLAADEIDDYFFLVEDQIANEDFEEVPETLNHLALDCFRLGRLYERLYWKQNHEGAALKAVRFSQRQSVRSEKGAQKSKENAAARKQLFSKIALDNLLDWVGEDGKNRTKAVRNIVLKNDLDGLLIRNGKPMSDSWFEDRISELKQTGEIDRASKKSPRAFQFFGKLPSAFLKPLGHLSACTNTCTKGNSMAQKLLRRPEVEALTGLSRTSIYRMMDENEFPRPVRIGKRAVAWRGS